jgi:hypothetical protein
VKENGAIGKGIATVGIWIGVGIVAAYAGPACMMVGLFAMIATALVWNR